jgi:hypothetical protein
MANRQLHIADVSVAELHRPQVSVFLSVDPASQIRVDGVLQAFDFGSHIDLPVVFRKRLIQALT